MTAVTANTMLVFKVEVANEQQGAELVTTLDPLSPSVDHYRSVPVLYGYTYHPNNTRELETNCPHMELRYTSMGTVTTTDVLRLFKLIRSLVNTTNIACYYRCSNIMGKFVLDNYQEGSVCEYAFNTCINMTPDELPQQFPISLHEYEQNWDWLTDVHTHYTFTKVYSLADIDTPACIEDQDEVLL